MTTLKEIRDRLNAATPGPWEATANGRVLGPPRPQHANERDIADTALQGGDAEFIAHAPEDMSCLLDALEAVQAVHEPIDAVMYSGEQAHKVQVCTGCGQDDGNWQQYPCPTVRAVAEALGEQR